MVDAAQEPEGGGPPPRRFALLIGAPKSATTTLHGWLAAAPGVARNTRAKEPGFFTDHGERTFTGPATEGFNRGGLSEERYLGSYRLAHPDDWALDGSTDYLSNRAAPEKLARFLEAGGREARMIAVLRDPIDRAFSEWQHTVRDGMQTESFRRSLALEPERAAAGMHPLFQHAARGRYHEQLTRWRDRFGDALLVMAYSDVRDAATASARIAAHLGLAPDAIAPTQTRRNESYVPRSRALKGLRKNETFRRIAKRVVPAALLRAGADMVASANKRRMSADPKDRAAAYDRLAEDIEACLADPRIPTDDWTTVHEERAARGLGPRP